MKFTRVYRTDNKTLKPKVAEKRKFALNLTISPLKTYYGKT